MTVLLGWEPRIAQASRGPDVALGKGAQRPGVHRKRPAAIVRYRSRPKATTPLPAPASWEIATEIGTWEIFVARNIFRERAVPWDDRASQVRLLPALEAAIEKTAERHGVPRSLMRVFAVIESSGNPRASKGSYHGVYQLSYSEFRRYSGRGNIFDLDANTDVAARKLRSESDAFARQWGRPPTALELYMIHQQGVEGAARHLGNPDLPAWQNMHLTGEGRHKGPRWSRLAIWGNVPTDQRFRFPGGVDSVTSRQFMDLWARKILKFGGDTPERPTGANVL
jgi:hypothetical protein